MITQYLSKIKLIDVPLGCFFCINDTLCYKDNLTVGTDTNYCVVLETYMGYPRYWLNRGYCTDSKKLIVYIVDERYISHISHSFQLTLF